MTRHRFILITLGIIQLLAAGFFVLLEEGNRVKYAQRGSIYAAIEIVEVLEDRGELVVPEDVGAANEQQGAISRIVREKIERRESSIELYIWALAILGLVILLAGFVPARPGGRARDVAPTDAQSRERSANR